jgi:3-oxoacyl-[acyl-carrier protein] reductase
MEVKKQVLITGATRGIGLAIAKMLANDYALILHGRNSAVLQSLVNQLPGNHNFIVADLSNKEQLSQLCKDLKKQSPDLYAVINNAGITKDKPLLFQSDADIDELFAVNVKAPLMINKAVLKLMHSKGRGVIINMGSCVGEMGNAFQVAYAMSKAAVLSMTKSIAKEVTALNPDSKVRAICVSPGFINTDMTANIDAATIENYVQLIPSKRIGTSEEVAAVVKFLLSEEATYINGVEIKVNGGLV